MLLILFLLILTMTLISYAYYRHQNATKSIGGHISPAKSFWLGYALFHYFIYPLFFYFLLENSWLKAFMLIISLWFFLRMLFQGFMMFVTHNWSPKIGMAHNLFTAFLLMISLVIFFENTSEHLHTKKVLISVFLLNLMLILVTDTLYAYRFNKIIGEKTKGKEAIWYASESQEFVKINNLTRRNNFFFALISSALLLIVLFL